MAKVAAASADEAPVSNMVTTETYREHTASSTADVSKLDEKAIWEAYNAADAVISQVAAKFNTTTDKVQEIAARMNAARMTKD